MSLKPKIEKTKTLTTELNKVKDEINNVIVGGGGINSSSLKELPTNITTIINGKKKIAIKKNLHIQCNTTRYSEVPNTIPLDLDFDPQVVILIGFDNNNYNDMAAVSLIHTSKETGFNNAFWITEVNSKNCILYTYGDSGMGAEVRSIIAIE